MLQDTGLRHLCLFAHFDRDDRVADYVLHYLKAIAACGFDIVVVSTSKLGDCDVRRLRTVATDVILRDNKGLDFASWACALARHGGRVSGNLLLANDSVYGPLGELSTAISRLLSVEADFYGMVESNQIAPHLQSWFLLFRPQVHRHPKFQDFFSRPFASLSKADIIRTGEIGISTELRGIGFRSHALSGLARGKGAQRRIQANPTHYFWRELIEDGVPFIKIELLRDNPANITNLSEWRSMLEARAPELIPMIESHLDRVAPDAGDKWRSLSYAPYFLKAHEAFVRRDFALARNGNRIGSVVNWWVWRAMLSAHRRINGPVSRS